MVFGPWNPILWVLAPLGTDEARSRGKLVWVYPLDFARAPKLSGFPGPERRTPSTTVFSLLLPVSTLWNNGGVLDYRVIGAWGTSTTRQSSIGSVQVVIMAPAVPKFYMAVSRNCASGIHERAHV